VLAVMLQERDYCNEDSRHQEEKGIGDSPKKPGVSVTSTDCSPPHDAPQAPNDFTHREMLASKWLNGNIIFNYFKEIMSIGIWELTKRIQPLHIF